MGRPMGSPNKPTSRFNGSAKLVTSKLCSQCKEVRPRSDWTVRKNGYLAVPCNPCRATMRKRHRLLKPEIYRAQRDRAAIKVMHGITLDQFRILAEKQHGVCAICGDAPNPRGFHRRLAVDHCHTRKVIRGLLCGRCNSGIGQFRDRPDLLRKAAIYVETASTGIPHKCRRKVAA